MYSIVQLRSFVEAVKNGTLSAGARALNLTQPAVSQHIKSLEARSGHDLLVRLPQGIVPTDAGEIMFQHAEKILSEHAEMDDHLNALNGVASGDFRFTTTEPMSQTGAVEFITRLRTVAPDLRVRLVTSDDILDVEAEQINLALRVGQPGSGGGVVRRIGEIAGVLVAAPEYLKRMGDPTDVSELINFDYLQYNEGIEQTEVPLVSPSGQIIYAPVAPAFAAQSLSLMLHALQRELGFAQVPLFATHHLISAGKLVQVLPGYTSQPKPLYLVQTKSKRNTLANQLARTTLLEVLADMPGVLLNDGASQTQRPYAFNQNEMRPEDLKS